MITQAQADARLDARLESEFVPDVMACLNRRPKQCELDAMVSLAYNVGAGAFAKSTLVSLYNAGKIQDAANQFPRWDKAGSVSIPGLRKRRAAERAVFLGASLTDALRIGDATS